MRRRNSSYETHSLEYLKQSFRKNTLKLTPRASESEETSNNNQFKSVSFEVDKQQFEQIL